MAVDSNLYKYDLDVQREIGIRIQEERLKIHISAADLGAYLDISANQMSRIETGKAKCDIKHIFLLCQLFECSADFLLFGKDNIPLLNSQQMLMIEKLYKSIQI